MHTIRGSVVPVKVVDIVVTTSYSTTTTTTITAYTHTDTRHHAGGTVQRWWWLHVHDGFSETSAIHGVHGAVFREGRRETVKTRD